MSARIEQAAILLMTLGESDAAQILKQMGPKEVQAVGAAMASLGSIQRSQVQEVMGDFLEAVSNQTGLTSESDTFIRNMMTEALGSEKANGLIDRILVGANTKGLDTLKWMDSRAVAELIRHEHPQIQAIVVSYLDPDMAAQVLGVFDERVRVDLIMRIANLDQIQPQALQELNDILEKQLSGNSGNATTSIGGIKTAANIMNFVDSAVEASMMEQIREADEPLGDQIQELMFVFEDLKNIEDRDMQRLLRDVNNDGLLLALKGSDDELKAMVFGNMSERAAEMLKDDLENKGPVKVSEVETAQKEILTLARRLADDGELSLGGGSGEDML